MSAYYATRTIGIQTATPTRNYETQYMLQASRMALFNSSTGFDAGYVAWRPCIYAMFANAQFALDAVSR